MKYFVTAEFNEEDLKKAVAAYVSNNNAVATCDIHVEIMQRHGEDMEPELVVKATYKTIQ